MTAGFDGQDWYFLDVICKRMEFPELTQTVKTWHRTWRADLLLIEGASIGHSLAQTLRGQNISGRVQAPVPVGSKEERLAACTAQLAQGNFLLPVEAPWLDAWKKELLAFPDWKNDDQVDALTQLLNFVFGRNGRPFKIEFDRFGNARPVRKPWSRPRGYSD